MAAHFAPPLEISKDNYHVIFASSDEEIDHKDSDIDISEVEDERDENDESGSEGEGNEPVEWTDRLHNIPVDNFTASVGITFEIDNESREIDVFKCFSMMKYSTLLCVKQTAILGKN